VRVFESVDELASAAGTDLGRTAWVQVTQERVDQFADATGDHQWIHVDPERAKDGPFKGTIAHGFFTLSLLPVFMHEAYEVVGASMAVNVGLNRVRFLAPVLVGSRLRGAVSLVSVDRLDGAVQAVVAVMIEIEGSEKPAAVVESIVRYFA
jgi:acyl dehydratase